MSLLKCLVHPNFLVALFTVGIFSFYTYPITDGDFFWHLKTGQWIGQHHALPSADPFSFTVSALNPFRPESQRIQFILKQYWLGQLALSGTWHLAGSAGIILLRACSYTGILLFLYWWMRKKGGGILPLVLIFFTGQILLSFPGERPQLFSFIFMPLLLFLLERIDPGVKKSPLLYLSVPLLMLIWANTHGAYLLGVALVGIYLFCHLLQWLIRRSALDLPLVTGLCSSVLITLVNPNGLGALREFFNTQSDYANSIYENLSPITVAMQMHEYFPVYWIFLFAAAATILFSLRSIRLTHLLVFASLALLSLTGLRYTAFPFLAAPLLTGYIKEWRWTPWRQAAVLCLLVVWIPLHLAKAEASIYQFRPSPNFPEKAAAFLQTVKPSPQLFNYYDWGGYLACFAPEYKVFSDGRGLVEEISTLHDNAMNGKGWEAVFDQYCINTVIIPGMSVSTGAPYPLALALATAAPWSLVYLDDAAMVFVRNIPGHADLIKRSAMDKQRVNEHLVKMATRLLQNAPRREAYWLTKANAEQVLGVRDAAAASYRRVLQLDPANDWARKMLQFGS